MPGDQEPVRVGLLHSVTGPMAASERLLLDAELMAIDEINGAGGVLGRRIEPVVADGASLPHVFARKSEELHTSGIDTFFGCWTSASRHAVRHVLETQGGLLWFPLHYEGLEESENIVYTGPCPNQQIAPAIEWIVDHGGGRIFFLGSDSIFARSADKLIRTVIDSNGLSCSVIGAEYVSSTAEDFASLIQEIRLKKPDFVFNALTGETGVSFLRQYYRAGLTSRQIPLMMAGMSEIDLQTVAASAAGHFSCWNYFQTLPSMVNERFVGRFRKRHGPHRVCSSPLVNAYTQLYLWASAVRIAASFSAVDVAQACIGSTFEGPAGKTEIQSNRHTSQRAFVGRLMADGQFDIVWESPDVILPLPWAGIAESEGAGHRYGKAEVSYLKALHTGRLIESDREENKGPGVDPWTTGTVLREVFYGSPAPTLLTDLGGTVLLANRACERILGFTEEELKGRRFAAFTSTDAFTSTEDVESGDGVLGRLASGIEHRGEREFVAKDGKAILLDMAVSTMRNKDGGRTYLVVTIGDAGERKRSEEALLLDEARLESLFRISQHRVGSLQSLLDSALEEAINLTRSGIGYIYHYSEETRKFTLNTWSTNVMKECNIREPQTVYELEKTGIWGEAVRQKRPILINDFRAFHPLKRGYPEGHAPLHRYLTVPVMMEGSIVAVVGVANKETDYDESDTRQLTLLMDAVWKIAEYKRAEHELAHLAAIVEHTEDAVISQTPDGIVQNWNRAAEELYGYEAAEMIGKPIGRIVPADRQDELTRLLERIRKGERARNLETQRLTRAGRTIDVALTLSPIRAPDGTITGVSSIVRDITRRKTSDLALKKSEATLKAVLAASPVGMMHLGVDAGIEWMNERAEAITGYTVAELHTAEARAILYGSETEMSRVRDELSRGAAHRGMGTADTQWIRKDGTVRDVRLTMSGMSYGGTTGEVIIIEDISERRRTERELVESEARYRTALEHSSDGIAIIQGKRHLYVNRKWCEMFGYEAAEIMAKERWDDLIHPDDAETIRSYSTRRDRGEPAPARYEFRAITKKGATIYFDCSLSPVVYEGRPAYFLFLRDITERKIAEEKVAESEERYRVVVENSNDGVSLSRGNQLVYVNQSLVDMFGGSSRDDLLGKPYEQLAHRDDRAMVAARMKEAEGATDLPLRYEFKGVTKDGASLDLESTVVRVVFKGRDHFMIYTRDVTANKAAEAELQKYYKFLENLSKTDGLTGLANRRRFDEALDHEWRRARRLGSPVSLLLLDIDFFKQYNDTYGHLAGDDCLRQVASVLMDVVRGPADTVARYGGEEFVCLLPDTDARGALWIARQIHVRLRLKSLPHAGSSVSESVTASIGIATLIPAPEVEASVLVQQADQSLYSAKQSGRNRTETHIQRATA